MLTTGLSERPLPQSGSCQVLALIQTRRHGVKHFSALEINCAEKISRGDSTKDPYVLPAFTAKLIDTDCLLRVRHRGAPVGPDPPARDVGASDEEATPHEGDKDDDEAQTVGQDHGATHAGKEAKHSAGHLLHHEEQKHLLEKSTDFGRVSCNLVCHAHPDYGLEY